MVRHILMEFDIAEIYENLSGRLNFHLDRTCLSTVLHDELPAFRLVSNHWRETCFRKTNFVEKHKILILYPTHLS